MQNKRKAFLAVLTMTLLGILASPLSVFAAEAEEAAQPALYATSVSYTHLTLPTN